MRAARARMGTITSELKESHQAIAMLNAQRERGESHLMAARSKLDAAQAKSSSYLEILRTHEWRWGFDQNRFRESDPGAAAADAGSAALQAQCDRLRAEVASLRAKLRTSDAPQVVEFEVEVPSRTSESAAKEWAAKIGRFDVTPRDARRRRQRETPRRETPRRRRRGETPSRSGAAVRAPRAKCGAAAVPAPRAKCGAPAFGRVGQNAALPPSGRGRPWKPGEMARLMAGIGAAVLVLAVVAWFYVPRCRRQCGHRRSSPQAPGTVIRDLSDLSRPDSCCLRADSSRDRRAPRAAPPPSKGSSLG